MNSLRIVVQQQDQQLREQLVAQLVEIGTDSVHESPGMEETITHCQARSTDIVLCHVLGEPSSCKGLLSNLAALPNKPAVAFYDTATDVCYLESICQRFGLCYLGFFGAPFDEVRLRRTLDLMRLQERGGPP